MAKIEDEVMLVLVYTNMSIDGKYE